MKKAIFAIFLALVFCSQTKAQEKVSSVYLADQGKYEYEIKVPAVPQYKDPIVAGDWMGWDKQSVTQESDFYHFKVTSFNGPIIFYWNDRKDKANPYLNESTPGYDPVTKCIKLYLQDGAVFSTEQVQKQPGPMGDNIIRWIDHGETVEVFLYNIPLPSGSQQPFALHSGNKWTETPQKISDASGWGSVTITKAQNKYITEGFIGLGYGGYKDNEKVYPATVQQSSYWNDEKKCFEIPIQKPLSPDEKKYN